MRQKYIWRLTAIVLALIVATSAAFSSENMVGKRFGKWHRGLFGFRGGIINAATMKVDGQKYDADVALTAGVLFDFPLTKRSTYGFTADLVDVQVAGVRQKAIDVGVAFKYAAYKKESMMALKPGFSVGYAYLAHWELFNASGYLTLRLFLETLFYSNHRYAWLLDFDIFWAPVGGNKEHDVTYGPAIMARFGLVL